MPSDNQDKHELLGQVALAISFVSATVSAVSCSWIVEKQRSCSVLDEALFSVSILLWAASLVLFWLSRLRQEVMKIAAIYIIPIPFLFWLTGLPGIRSKFVVIIGSQLGGYIECKARRESSPHRETQDEAV